MSERCGLRALWALPVRAWAEDLLMARPTQAFPEAMASL